MTDYISRQAILSEFENRFCVFCSNEKCVETCKLAYIKHAIQGINAADVRPVVHGGWLRGPMWSEGFGMGESYGHYWDCSECRKRVRGGYNGCGYDYCPHCGADMRGENTDA